MKTNTLSINIEYVGIKKNIQVLISEEHLRDVMGIDGATYLNENAEAIIKDFSALMLLNCPVKFLKTP